MSAPKIGGKRPVTRRVTTSTGNEVEIRYLWIDADHVEIVSYRRKTPGKTQFRRERDEEGRVVRVDQLPEAVRPDAPEASEPPDNVLSSGAIGGPNMAGDPKADRRSITSRANLGAFVNAKLDPSGTTVVAVRIPTRLIPKLDKARGAASRSEWIRGEIEEALG